MKTEKYLNLEWTPVENNCSTFVKKVYFDMFNKEIELISVDANSRMDCSRVLANRSSYNNFKEIEKKDVVDGDIVTMGQSSRPSHIGIIVNGLILHCRKNFGVLQQTEVSLNRSGWKVISYRRYIDAV